MILWGRLPHRTVFTSFDWLAYAETNTSVDAMTQRKQVEQLLFQRKLEEGLQSWVTKLRGEASSIHIQRIKL